MEKRIRARVWLLFLLPLSCLSFAAEGEGIVATNSESCLAEPDSESRGDAPVRLVSTPPGGIDRGNIKDAESSQNKVIDSLRRAALDDDAFDYGLNKNRPKRRSKSLDDLFLSEVEVNLTKKEIQAISASKAWRDGEAVQVNPTYGPDGSVEYLFGAEQPSIVCAVWQLTVVQLQRGEQVTSVNLGDSQRWMIDVVIAGGDTTNILIKPKDVGLETSMVITTNRGRTYHLRLRSHRTEYIPFVKFSYVDEAMNKLDQIKGKLAVKREKDTIPETNEYLGDLDFNYTVSGKASWKPVRVYNNGEKTIIEMPVKYKQVGAPILHELKKERRLLGKDTTVMLEYSVHINPVI